MGFMGLFIPGRLHLQHRHLGQPTFGGTVRMLVFTIAQGLYLSGHLKDETRPPIAEETRTSVRRSDIVELCAARGA